MPYLGNTPSTSFATIVKDTFNGGSTGYTLSKVATTNSVSVFVENVRQEPTTAYSVSGTTLTFTATTPSGTGNIYVLHMNPTTTTTHPAAQNLTAVNGTLTGTLGVTGATTAAAITASGVVDITDATDASDATGDTGALRTEGGASIAKKLYVGTDLDVDGTANLDVVDIDGAVDMASTLAVAGVSSLTNKLTVLAADGTVDNDWVMDVRNNETTDDRSYGLRVSAGSSTTDRALDILDHAQANTLLRINGSGHVTKPSTPYFFGGRSAGQTGSGSDFVSNVAQDNRGSHYNTSNGRFTAPVTGEYLCHFKTFSSPQNLSAGHYQASLRINDTAYSVFYFYHTGSSHAPIEWSQIVRISAGDYFTHYLHGSLTVYGNDWTYAQQGFYLIG